MLHSLCYASFAVCVCSTEHECVVVLTTNMLVSLNSLLLLSVDALGPEFDVPA